MEFTKTKWTYCGALFPHSCLNLIWDIGLCGILQSEQLRAPWLITQEHGIWGGKAGVTIILLSDCFLGKLNENFLRRIRSLLRWEKNEFSVKISLHNLLDAKNNVNYEKNQKKMNRSFLTKLADWRREKATDNSDFIATSIFSVKCIAHLLFWIELNNCPC